MRHFDDFDDFDEDQKSYRAQKKARDEELRRKRKEVQRHDDAVVVKNKKNKPVRPDRFEDFD